MRRFLRHSRNFPSLFFFRVSGQSFLRIANPRDLTNGLSRLLFYQLWVFIDVADDFIRDELFAGEPGAGATGNGQPIRVNEMLAVLREISD